MLRKGEEKINFNNHGRMKNFILFIFLLFLSFWLLKNFGIFFCLVYIMALGGIFLFVAYKKDKNIPYLSSFLKNQYFRTKFKISLLKNEHNASNLPLTQFFAKRKMRETAKKIRIFTNQTYLKVLFYLILITKNSKEGFEILREELQETYGNALKIIAKGDDNKKEWITLEKLTNKVKNGEIEDTTILKKIILKLFDFHQKNRRRAMIFSYISLSLVILAIAISGLITSFIFPTIFKSNAATYSWNQTSWEVETEHDASHLSNQSGWNEYSSASSTILIGDGKDLKLDRFNLFAHYTFDDKDVSGTTVADKSGKGNNGTLGDGATPSTYPTTGAAGKLREALSFDGGDYVNCGNSDELNVGTGDYTIEVWINPDQINSETIFGRYQDETNKFYLMLNSASSVQFYNEVSGTTYASANASLSQSFATGAWQHLAAVMSRKDDVVYFYRNGALVGTGNAMSASGIDISNTGYSYIGQRQASTDMFHGDMDDFKIYRRALSATDIATHYNLYTEKYTLASSDLSGTTVYGRKGADLTAVGSPTAATGFDGVSNSAMQFNGTSQYLTQKVYDTKQGVVHMQTYNGAALFEDLGQDFSPYVAEDGNNPYMIVVTDTAGKKAWGYIGTEGGGEETLSNSVVTNGDFSSWVNDNPTWWSVYESGTAVITEDPPGQCRFTRPDNLAYISTHLTLGKLYKYSLDLASITGSFDIRNNSGVTIYGGPWTTTGTKTGYFTPDANDNFQFIPIFFGTVVVMDNVVIQEVTAPPADQGVLIYSTKTGTTRNWARIDDGFKPNSVASYEIRKSDFQIEGANQQFTLGAWIKVNDSGNDGLIMGEFGDNSLERYALKFKAEDNSITFVVKDDIDYQMARTSVDSIIESEILMLRLPCLMSPLPMW